MPLLPGCSRFQYASSPLASCTLHGRCSSRAQASLQASASPSSSPRLRFPDTSKMSALLRRPSPSPRHLALPALHRSCLPWQPLRPSPRPASAKSRPWRHPRPPSTKAPSPSCSFLGFPRPSLRFPRASCATPPPSLSVRSPSTRFCFFVRFFFVCFVASSSFGPFVL